MSVPASAAAWHPDPHDPSQLRWWDGSTWTEHVHRGGAPATQVAPGVPIASNHPVTQPTSMAYAQPALTTHGAIQATPGALPYAMAGQSVTWNSLAITAFCFSMAGLIIPLIIVVGFILGIVALVKMGNAAAPQRGKGLAIAAIAVPAGLFMIGFIYGVAKAGGAA